jgi:hypothetical protein
VDEVNSLDINVDGALDDIMADLAAEDPADLEEGDNDAGGEEDEEEWGGMDADAKDQSAAQGHQPGTKPKKPPTGEELRTIKDATDLFRSSSFKLQVRLSWNYFDKPIMIGLNLD